MLYCSGFINFQSVYASKNLEVSRYAVLLPYNYDSSVLRSEGKYSLLMDQVAFRQPAFFHIVLPIYLNPDVYYAFFEVSASLAEVC